MSDRCVYQDVMKEYVEEGKENTVELGLAMVADAIRNAATDLGNGGAATPMGAIEALGKVVKDGCEDIALTIHNTISEHGIGGD